MQKLDFLKKTSSIFQSLPDNDNTMKILRWKDELHYDTDLDYNLLNTRVSMRWRPLIDQLTIADLENWTTPPYADTPNFILFGKIKKKNQFFRLLKSCSSGICIHYGDFSAYKKHLIELEPYIQILSNISHVVWYMQYPLSDVNVNNQSVYQNNVSINNCNKAAKRIFQ